MSLEQLADDSITDKNTVHSYLPLYQTLLSGKKETALNVLEVGIYRGGSIKLWGDFFTNATVYGLDITDEHIACESIKTHERIRLYTSVNAYDTNFVTSEFINNAVKFDFLLDDGPHSLESMIKFIQLYSNLMTDDGILIIEDVQDSSWIAVLESTVPHQLRQFIKVYDLRPNKGRYDDIVFTIDRSRQ